MSRPIAQALGLARARRISPLRRAPDGAFLRERHLLLVLDNFEQVVAAAPLSRPTCSRVCPGLKVLVTSRETLRVAGEHEFPVPPLALPDRDRADVRRRELATCEAVALFVQRARAVQTRLRR